MIQNKIIDAKVIKKEEDLMPILKEGIDSVKEKDSLSKKIKEEKGSNANVIYVAHVKEKIQNAQRKLKEVYCEDRIEGQCNFIKGCSNCNKINKIFKEEFGEELTSLCREKNNGK